MKKWVLTIMNAGINEDYNFIDINRIQISNTLFIFGVPLILINTILNILEKDNVGLSLGFIWFVFLAIPIFLNLIKNHHLAYSYTVFLTVFCANTVYMVFGKEVIITPMYILGVLITIFFFDKLISRLVLIAIIIANYLFVYGYYLSYYPPLATDVVIGQNIHFYFLFAIFGVTAISMKILKATNNQLLKTEKLNKKLAIKNQEIERFAYVTSHDLKEPIRNISRFSGLIKRKVDNEEIMEYLTFINENARYLDEMVGAVQKFMEISEENLVFESVDVNKIVDDIKNKLTKKNISKHLKITYQNLPVIDGIKIQIIVLLEQLIDNAIKYNHNETPNITILYQDLENVHQFQIKDNGIGVEEEFNQRIFLPFKKLHHKSTYKGAGIGLSICKRVIDNHNGTIWVKDNDDEGVSVYFTISKTT